MSFKSLFPDAVIPELDLPTYMFSHTKKTTAYGQNAGMVAMIQDSQEMTFAQFEANSVAFGSGLYNSLGFRQGDVLATVLTNHIMYPVVTMGTLMAGGVVTAANPAYTARELSHQLNMTKAKVIVTLQEFLPMVHEALKIARLQIPATHIMTVDSSSCTIMQLFSERSFPRVYLNTRKQTANTPAFIVFSSGTSGTPKGVVLSHRNLVANAVQFLAVDRHDSKLKAALKGKKHRRWLQVLPMFHIYGILIINVTILTGASVVFMDKFDFPSFCGLLQDHKIDTVYVAPPIILALAKSPVTKKYDLSHLVNITSGAAPLSRELQMEAEKKLGVFVTQGFGMSETSPLVARSSAGTGIPGSVGPLCPNTEAIFYDESGKPVGVNQVGELCVRGPQVMIGYLDNKSATDETIQSDGFLHTGDVGYIDDAGNIFITDRKKELIKYKGFQIPPAEIEGLLTDHPAVMDAAVIPVYDESRASEIPKAFVVVSPDFKKPGVEKDIADWLAARVVDYKRLRGGVELIDAIPKSATGKILRRVLKDLEKSRLQSKSKL